MSEHSELLKDARTVAERLRHTAAATIHTLIDIVDRQDEEAVSLKGTMKRYLATKQSAFDELVAACKASDAAMSVLICEHDDFRVVTEGAWINLRAARHLTRRAVELAEPKSDVDEEQLAKGETDERA